MYCSTCGSEIKPELNYCNRCGARVDKLTAIEKPSRALGVLSAGTSFVGFCGLGMTIALVVILLQNHVVIEAVVMLTLAFLITVFGICFMMIRQISQMTGGNAPRLKESAPENLKLNSPNTAQLEEPRQPARSVTENTTRTLEKELVK